MNAGTKKSPSIALMLAVYAALLCLLGLTVLAAHFPLGAAALLVALAIAMLKSTLVICYYMHIRYSSRVTWIFVIAGFLWLCIMFMLTFAEYAGRSGLTRAQPLSTSTESPR